MARDNQLEQVSVSFELKKDQMRVKMIKDQMRKEK